MLLSHPRTTKASAEAFPDDLRNHDQFGSVTIYLSFLVLFFGILVTKDIGVFTKHLGFT